MLALAFFGLEMIGMPFENWKVFSKKEGVFYVAAGAAPILVSCGCFRLLDISAIYELLYGEFQALVSLLIQNITLSVRRLKCRSRSKSIGAGTNTSIHLIFNW